MERTAYEYLRGWYSSQNIIHMIKSGTMRWAGHVLGRGEKKPDRKGTRERPRR